MVVTVGAVVTAPMPVDLVRRSRRRRRPVVRGNGEIPTPLRDLIKDVETPLGIRFLIGFVRRANRDRESASLAARADQADGSDFSRPITPGGSKQTFALIEMIHKAGDPRRGTAGIEPTPFKS